MPGRIVLQKKRLIPYYSLPRDLFNELYGNFGNLVVIIKIA